MPPKSTGLTGQIERLDLSEPAAAPSSSSNGAVAPSTLSAEDRNTILSCFNKLLKLIEKLESEAAEPLETTIIIDATRLAEYSDVLSHQLTKFVLFVSQGEAAVLLNSTEELSTHVTGISCSLRALLHPSSNALGVVAGPTQRAHILTVHRAILTGATAILKQLQTHMLSKQNTKLDASLTGRAWELIEKQLKSTPLTNATAVGRSINQQCSVLKDAKAELDQVHIATGDEKEDDDDLADDDDDEDGDLVLDAGGDDAFTEEEFRVVPSVRHLTTIAQTLVKSLYMYILKVKIDETVPGNVDWLELVLKQVQTIGIKLDDLIGALYSPQDRAAVLAAADAMAKELRETALSIVRHNVSANADWPVKSSSSTEIAASSAVPSAFASCPSCQQVIDDAVALQQPSDDNHAQRIEWLKKCIAQIHEGHAQTDAFR